MSEEQHYSELDLNLDEIENSTDAVPTKEGEFLWEITNTFLGRSGDDKKFPGAPYIRALAKPISGTKYDNTVLYKRMSIFVGLPTAAMDTETKQSCNNQLRKVCGTFKVPVKVFMAQAAKLAFDVQNANAGFLEGKQGKIIVVVKKTEDYGDQNEPAREGWLVN